MARFCGKCGTKLDETTGLCPNCDAEKIKESSKQENLNEISEMKQKSMQEFNEVLTRKEIKKKRKIDKKIQKKAKRKEKWEKFTIKQKIKRVFLKLIMWFILLCVLSGGILGGLVYYGIVDIPFIEHIINEIILVDYADDVERELPETNVSDFTLHLSSDVNIITDLEQGITFVNNELLVTLESSANRLQLEEYIGQFGGTIVGEIYELSDYQILLNQEYSIDELNKILEELKKQPWVISASPNYCIKIDTQYIPNDRKWINKWGDIPDDINWGVEAIEAQGAWEHIDNMTTKVNVGVIDNMFDIWHEDLLFAEMPLGNNLAVNNSGWDNHGTHTSGTIAAIMNNKRGISGISTNCNLYGVSYVGLAVGEYDTLQSMKVALYYLIVTNNCSVINMSIGINHLTFEASRGGKVATEELNNLALGIEDLLERLIDKGYQFLICKSAGNQNEVGGGYCYFKKDKDDDDYPYEYYSYNDYLKFLKGEDGYEYLAEYKDKRKEIESRLESGNVDAKFDFLGIIENQRVKDRIIIVGAAQNLGTHKEGGFLWFGRKIVHDGFMIAPFSQCGKRVDILAPGVEIYSTVKNGYSSLDGTSMAAPHVSGVAALVFSINANLDAKNVKEIICSTGINSYGEEAYRLLNANNAVEAAMEWEEYENRPQADEPVITSSDERDIVLVLDVSGSMSGTPMEETKKASEKFIDTILENDATIGIVAYDNSAGRLSGFSTDKIVLKDTILNLADGGGTNIEAGLREAESMLTSSSAKKRIIVLMSDGEPNDGKQGDELIEYANQIKEEGILIYTIGFFESLGNKSSAQLLMEKMASDGCHYEVANASELVFFFEDMADQINGQKYIYVRIACPVDVSVTYQGQTLCSAEDKLNLRTDFGTLTFEENEETSSNGADNRVKVLRLKEEDDYDVKIEGTGHGIMNYTIGFMDEDGNYNDFRKFENIRITKKTEINTVAGVAEESVLNIDEDGDGKYDIKLRAEKNGYGEEVKIVEWVYYAVIGAGALIVIDIIIVIMLKKKRKNKVR